MTKFAMIGAACLAAALTTASPVLARGGHFHGGGFGVVPGIAAGLIAGAAVAATAGPGYAYGPGYGPGYYDNSYAYDNGYNRAYDDGYAARNGFVCRPGTWFRGEDGRPHPCQ